MARIFITFVGTGEYKPVVYSGVDGGRSAPTRFVQRAILEALGPASFDRIEVFGTDTSLAKNKGGLEAEFRALGLEHSVHVHRIPEAFDEATQWVWFEQLLDVVAPFDTLVFDTTHGFRAVPIVMCAAVGYLRRAKRAVVEGIFYGVEPPRDAAEGTPGQLVDMSRFFVIHDWADGVSRLVESADASKLAALAADTTTGSFSGLRDPDLVRALERFTSVLKNVEVHAVEEAAGDALARLRAQQFAARTGAERQLVQLVIDKVTTLTVAEPTEGRYTLGYLALQLRVAELLVEHGLLMQSFTVLREMVGSIGMLGVPDRHRARPMANAKGRSLRIRYAEAFLQMLPRPPLEWKFDGDRAEVVNALLPWYERVVATAPSLREDMQELTELRNGFDHAWTSREGPRADVADRARVLCQRLRAVVDALPAP